MRKIKSTSLKEIVKKKRIQSQFLSTVIETKRFIVLYFIGKISVMW